MPDPSGRPGWGQRQVLTPARPLPVCGLVGWEGVPAAPWVCFPRESGRVARAPSPGSVRLSPHPPALAPGTGSALPRGGLQRALRSPGWAAGGTAGLGAGRGWGRGRPRLARSPCAHHLNCFRKMLRFRLFLESRKVIWNARSRESGTRRRHGAPPPSEPPAPAQPHLLGLLPGGGSCGLLGLRHGEGEEPLDAGEVRLHHLGAQAVQRRPHGAALCG